MRDSRFAILVLAAALLSCNQSTPLPPTDSTASTTATVARARSSDQVQQDAARSPRQVVEELGVRLKNVSLLAPPDVAARAMDENYSDLVTPELLRLWKDDPSSAPGRQVSSPWPERIDVTHVSQTSDDKAVITGELLEMTSGGEGGRPAVEIELVQREGNWRVSAFRVLSPPSSTDEEADRSAAVKVIEEYYAAIRRRDYSTAWSYWRPPGPPDQTLEQFSRGYAETHSVEVQAGAPSRVEAAAGSRYIDVPVTISAKQTDGRIRRFNGTYTLRRAVVDGATEEQRRWRIEKASVREIS